MALQQYVADIKAKLVASAAVATITIVEERLLPDRGYFRARLTLSNSDFLNRYRTRVDHWPLVSDELAFGPIPGDGGWCA